MVNKVIDYLGNPQIHAIAIEFVRNHLPQITK
jgi:hypothetical protein